MLSYCDHLGNVSSHQGPEGGMVCHACHGMVCYCIAFQSGSVLFLKTICFSIVTVDILQNCIE